MKAEHMEKICMLCFIMENLDSKNMNLVLY